MTIIILLRTLTRKSYFKNGKQFKDYRVQELLDLKKSRELVAAYFNVSKITYTEDILDELNIIGSYRIEKPGKDNDLYKKFLEANGYKTHSRRGGGGADKLKKASGPLKKGYLQSRNHGK